MLNKFERSAAQRKTEDDASLECVNTDQEVTTPQSEPAFSDAQISQPPDEQLLLEACSFYTASGDASWHFDSDDSAMNHHEVLLYAPVSGPDYTLKTNALGA